MPIVSNVRMTREEAEGFMEAIMAARVEFSATARKAIRSRPTTPEGHARKMAIVENANTQRERI